MNDLHYTAEIAHRQAALTGEAEVARRARRSRRHPGRGTTARRRVFAAPPGIALGSA